MPAYYPSNIHNFARSKLAALALLGCIMDHGEGFWGEFSLPLSFDFPLPSSPHLIIHLLVGPAIGIGKSHLKYSF